MNYSSIFSFVSKTTSLSYNSTYFTIVSKVDIMSEERPLPS
jgi:hypothetical protein